MSSEPTSKARAESILQRPYRVGILGATGLVGQRLVQRLETHPWFRTTVVAASDRSAGRPYAEATRWSLSGAPPSQIATMTVRSCRADEFGDCDLVLSALDAAPAREIEPELARGGFPVISNSSAWRMGDDVPLVIPEVNPDHLGLVERQRSKTGGGFIVTNPNCSATGLALALAPLHSAFGLRRLVVTTLQAISGAGASGPRALELMDNVVPWIPGEEDKLESELSKILGSMTPDSVRPLSLEVSAHCHRVPVIDGHLEAVSLECERQVRPEEAAESMRGFRGEVASLGLPSSIPQPIVVREEDDRPQPRLDRDAGGGMAVVVGRIRPCPVLGLRLVLLSHNTVRGAAGGTLLNAELLAARGLLRPEASR